MPSPRLVSINIVPAGGEQTVEVPRARLVAGRGIEEDRYFLGTGTYSKSSPEGRQLTLIEKEAIDAIAEEEGIEIPPGEARRNLVTEGVPLNHLVGREFTVGGVRVKGVRLCEPCKHLEALTAKNGIRLALVHRGGLRADILTDGEISAGDPIVLDP